MVHNKKEIVEYLKVNIFNIFGTKTCHAMNGGFTLWIDSDLVDFETNSFFML